jgi:uncharacterized iron-regulated membrane protein
MGTRIIHLVGAALIGTFVYGPWSNIAWFVALMQFGVIPLLTLSGFVMWQQARVLAWLRPRGERRNEGTGNT